MSLEKAKQDLSTQRLLLRPLTVADAAGMFEVYRDEATMEFWSDPPVATIEEAAAMVQADIDYAADGAAVFWAITPTGGGIAIGKVTLIHYSAQNRRAEIGYILNRQYWRQGLMAEAVTTVIDFAFTQLGLHRIEADTDVANVGSIALLEKLGFRREGIFRDRWNVYGQWADSVMLGLLESDWNSP